MAEPRQDGTYSKWVGLVFIFNIIVGTGALTLPAAFAKAGWLLGTISIIFFAFISFITATYVIECMACANAVMKWESLLREPNLGSIQEETDTDNDVDENTPMRPGLTRRNDEQQPQEQLLLPRDEDDRFYNLDTRVELGKMATMFFTPLGRLAFYVTMILYLYGDLSIYSVAISKSTMDVVCSFSQDVNSTNPSFDLPCFNQTTIDDSMIFTRLKCYRLVLLTFTMALGPFVFFNVQKTKYLQIFTTSTRWMAFIIMITFAVKSLIDHGPKGTPPVVKMAGIPALFGSSVYSFMCHHSLPGIITPITSKRKLSSYISIDFFLIAVFYLLLALTGVFAFEHLEDLYTLNFIPKSDANTFLKIVEYFLGLFPVFTLSTSFPVIAITLRNNIQALFLDVDRLESYNIVLRQIIFPIVTILPPLLLTLFFEDITFLVSIIGSYGGTGIQYLIPTFLVIAARKQTERSLGPMIQNRYKSPFQHVLWSVFILTWSIVCVIIVSYNLAQKNSTHKYLHYSIW